jgi:hypothetical protein
MNEKKPINQSNKQKRMETELNLVGERGPDDLGLLSDPTGEIDVETACVAPRENNRNAF